MFDGLLKSKFYSKCKSDIKMTRTRIELIKKKRNAMQKYLRNDVADLLKNGLDYNAYGRAEGLLAELNRSECYDSVDRYCEHISTHVSAMDKQRECPEECTEAASSLMFAAARFADLPELRELRTMFSERYGNSLDCYVNKQFSEKLKSCHPSKDLKLQLLQEVAAESGLEWNSKALENKLFSESANNKNLARETDDKGGTIQRGTRYEFYPAREPNPETKRDLPHHDAMSPPVKDIQVDRIEKTVKPIEGAPVRKTPMEEVEDKPLKYRWIAPPYTKSEVNKTKDKVEPKEASDAEDNPVLGAKPSWKSVRTRNNKPSLGGGSEGDEKEKEINKESAAQGQRILKFFDGGSREPQQDEEEKMMDRLLQYFSRKKVAHKDSNVEPVVKTTPQHEHRARDGPNRVSSLPAEATSETPKTHTRATSFQPELLNGKAHVHPNLPDYDDFVARLAAFRGK